MTKVETAKIMAILYEYYRFGNQITISESSIAAWHLMIGEYDYHIAERAIINLAKNDEREYAKFPAPGIVRKAIKDEVKTYFGIANKAYSNTDYKTLNEKEKCICSEESYNRYKELSVEDKIKNREAFIRFMENADKKLLEGKNND